MNMSMRMSKRNDIERCVREYEEWVRPSKGGVGMTEYIEVIPVTKSNGMRYVRRYGDEHGFYDEEVESDFKLAPKRSREVLLGTFCKPAVTRASLEAGGALEVNDWFDLARRRGALTIADVLKMKVGESIKVMAIHRNILDATEPANAPNVAHSPKRFFSG